MRITQFNLEDLPDFRKAVQPTSPNKGRRHPDRPEEELPGASEQLVAETRTLLDDGATPSTRGRIDRANVGVLRQEGTITDLPHDRADERGQRQRLRDPRRGAQGHGRAVIVGNNPSGRGLVQTFFNLRFVGDFCYHSEVHPAGTVIDKVGLSP